MHEVTSFRFVQILTISLPLFAGIACGRSGLVSEDPPQVSAPSDASAVPDARVAASDAGVTPDAAGEAAPSVVASGLDVPKAVVADAANVYVATNAGVRVIPIRP